MARTQDSATDHLERASRGDGDAFEALARQWIGDLDAIARLILRDRDMAEDAVQEALVTAWRKLPTLKDPTKLDAWLKRVLLNACRDQHRRRDRRERRERLGGRVLRASTPDSSELLAERDELDTALRQITIEQRTVLVLRYYAGLDIPEIADVLQVPRGTVGSRLHYALRALRSAVDAAARRTSQEGGARWTVSAPKPASNVGLRTDSAATRPWKQSPIARLRPR